MADINEDELTGYQPPSDSTGGLTPVSITATGTVAANTRENVTVPGAPITRTLPPLPTSGQDPISWLINDDARTVTEANYIRIQPAAGQRLASHLAIDEPLDLDGPGMWASGGASAGDTDWGLQLQASTLVPPAQPGVEGSVEMNPGATTNVASEYAEGSFIANFNSGASTNTNNVTIGWRKSGKQIFLDFPAVSTITATATLSYFETTAGAIPAAIRPKRTHEVFVRTRTNGSSDATPAVLTPQTNGAIQFAKTSGNFTSGQTANGWNACEISYSIA